MKRRARLLPVFVIAVSVSCVLTGCQKESAETEASSEVMTEEATEAVEEPETETEKKKATVTYKEKGGMFSIKLPDDTWEAEEGENEWTFTSKEQGVITVIHYEGEETEGLVFPGSEDEVLENLEEAGKSKTDYAVVEYEKDSLGEYEAYHTTIKCKNESSTYAYSVAYNLVGEEDIYSVNGQVIQDDADAMEAIRDAVESFKLLGSSSTSESDESEQEEDEAEDDQTLETTGSTEGQYIYDSAGNAVYVYQDGNGNWVDSSGRYYSFTSSTITDSSGNSYTYVRPTTSETSAASDNSSSGSDSSSDSSTAAAAPETSSFYDNEGHLINVQKDGNGNWVDSNGIVYTFGAYGVTDNYGNYYPYDNSTSGSGSSGSSGSSVSSGGDTNGFYDDQGNYITVTQDANGNWVDSGGMEYVFGDTGVTDSYGNFYPY